MVRWDRAGTVSVPDAVTLTIGMLNTKGVVMSGAVISTTSVAIADPDTSATTTKVASPTSSSDVVRSGEHALQASTDETTSSPTLWLSLQRVRDRQAIEPAVCRALRSSHDNVGREPGLELPGPRPGWNEQSRCIYDHGGLERKKQETDVLIEHHH